MDNDSIGIALLDTGVGFTVFDRDVDENVPYGTFALTLANTDYNKIRESIFDTIHKFFDNGLNPNDTELFVQTLYRKINFQIGLSSIGYLRGDKTYIFTKPLLMEILNRIQAVHLDITDIEKCLPVIFSHPQILRVRKYNR